MIISVGYRVKSKIATQFRIWATTILKQYLLDGYTVNERRLAQMHKLLQIVARSDDIMITGVADVLSRYASGLDLLDDYDHQRVSQLKARDVGEWKLTYNEARSFVDSIQYTERGNLFGNEKDDSFKSALGAIYQTFGGRDVYPSVQEKAANLLYLVVKNHAFSDGNKRIAAVLFVFFLDRNHAFADRTVNYLSPTTLLRR